MPLKKYYMTCIQQLGYEDDPNQLHVIDKLHALQQDFIVPQEQKSGLLKALDLFRGSKPAEPIKGCYLWGGVGRGKTWMMDLFFNTIPVENKLRIHFHHFMQKVHVDLTQLKGNQDPLKIIASRWSEKYSLICLDEFHVTDITDAMLLYGLLDALFENGIVLVATSNIHPDDLYKNGLQRDRFLPAIELIKKHTNIIHTDGDGDHRFRGVDIAASYYSPINDKNKKLFREQFEKTAIEWSESSKAVIINKREIEIEAISTHVVWFKFEAICGGVRSTKDYMEIGKRYNTVFISDVPQMSEERDDKARRFIHLVELYDNKIRLVLIAETSIQELYRGRRLQFEFKRTASRITEMQSQEYLDRSLATKDSFLQ